MRPEETSIWTEPSAVAIAQGGDGPRLAHLARPARRKLDALRGTLEPDELDRAARFHFEKHRRHFVVARGFLRSVIARYVETLPSALRFAYGVYGKPEFGE